MTLYLHGEELTFDGLRLDVYQRTRESQCYILQEILEGVFPAFKAQGFYFPEMLEAFILAAQQHYSDTTGWQLFYDAMQNIDDRHKPKEFTVKFFDDFLRACRAERYHLIEVLEGFDFAINTNLPPSGESQEKSLHFLNEVCCKLIELRELETDVKYNREPTVTNLHTIKESSQPELKFA